MEIVMFYNCLDWTNRELVKHLKKFGCKTKLIDIHKFYLNIHLKNKSKCLYLNRVYPSEKSINTIRFMLEISKHLENLGLKIINSFDASFIDYSKTEACSILEASNMPVPKTYLLSTFEAAKLLAPKLKYPKIIKADTGGRASHVYKVNSKKEFLNIVQNLLRSHLIHIEDFYEPPEYVTRIFVLGYSFEMAYKKFLLRDHWKASVSKGSKIELYNDISNKLCKISERIAKLIKAEIIAFDVIEAENKPIFIDLNLTPVFSRKNLKFYKCNPVEKIARYIASI